MDSAPVAAPSAAASTDQHSHLNGSGNGALSAGQLSEAEIKRIRQRRRLASKTPEQRRKLLQYQRRHNEKDERLYYCDYCDLFVSSRHRAWMTHVRSARHMDAFQSYYDLVAHAESVWMTEINREVELARSREVHRLQQRSAGMGAATPLAAQCIAPGIVVGGAPAIAPGRLPPPPPLPHTPHGEAQVSRPVTIRVGSQTILPPAAPAASSAAVATPSTDAERRRKSANEPPAVHAMNSETPHQHGDAPRC
ncbi:hypothetical protein LSCM1_04611 [Leishmania martiniquensis]|uniref:U1-C C2H2-type zinc finger domain-containing protein n=1 Tax=Leishmania martiniquensis TaxID=1580590 RepID=A0A836HMJ1_9TRYP|nr:hypothetical protein LSCM1_04611 [Leishmania martiniquensis]